MDSTQAAPLLLRLSLVDRRALSWVASRRPSTLVAVMRAITVTGNAPVVAAALAAWLLVRPSAHAMQVAAATVLGLALFSVAKRLCRRARPAAGALLRAPDEFSMPSGHATCAWAIAVVVAASWPPLAPLALTWAAAVSASRVVLGVHFPFDVLAGGALGSAAALAVLALVGA